MIVRLGNHDLYALPFNVFVKCISSVRLYHPYNPESPYILLVECSETFIIVYNYSKTEQIINLQSSFDSDKFDSNSFSISVDSSILVKISISRN
jgi:hypothetical protein